MKYLFRKTKDLEIRLLKKSDYDSWKESYLSILNSKNIWDAKAKSADELKKSEFIKLLRSQNNQRKTDSYYDLAVFEIKSGKMVGRVSVMNVIRSVSQTAFLGYFLHNNFWGKGYGKQATKAMIDIAFKDLNLHRVEAGIEPTNRRSIMLARSLKMRKEGLKKRVVYLRNAWQDLIIYSLTCEDLNVKWKGLTKIRPK